MSVEQIKSSLASLSPAERDEVSAFLFRLRHADNSEYQERIDTRMADKDPACWLTLEEVKKRLNLAASS